MSPNALPTLRSSPTSKSPSHTCSFHGSDETPGPPERLRYSARLTTSTVTLPSNSSRLISSTRAIVRASSASRSLAFRPSPVVTSIASSYQ